MSRAEVRVGEEVTGRIGPGLLVLLGAGDEDTDADLGYMVDKVVGLRIFADDDGNMNRSVVDVGGSLLVVSQFTLYGDARKGRRPSFVKAMAPGPAEQMYERFVARGARDGRSGRDGTISRDDARRARQRRTRDAVARFEAAVLTRTPTSMVVVRVAVASVVAITLATGARASEPEMFGMGARTPGMAGTGVGRRRRLRRDLHESGGSRRADGAAADARLRARAVTS